MAELPLTGLSLPDSGRPTQLPPALGPLTGLSLPDSGGPTQLPPALGPLPADDDSRLKTDLIDEIFGVSELAAPEPEPEPSRASLRTSLEEEPPAENLETVALNLEHALSEVFDEVEGTGEATPADGDGDGGGDGGADGGGGADDGGGGDGETVSNGRVESSNQPEAEEGKRQTAAAAADDDDDDIVVLDEISPTPAPAARGKYRLLGPASRRKPGALAAGITGKLKCILRGPASKRKDFAELGPPSSRMPPAGSASSDSDVELEQTLTPEDIKMMTEARRLKVGVSLRLNNVCLETSQTARQWAVTLQQRREARKRHWEEVRRGPRPQPTPRRTSRARGRGRHAPQSLTQLSQPTPVNFAATKQLMNLINRGVVQMTTVEGSAPVNGRPRAVTPQQRGRGRRPVVVAAGRGRAMVQIPAGSLQQRHLLPVGRALPRPQDRIMMKTQGPGAAELAAIPDLGDKQRSQLMKLLQGNNGTSISPSPVGSHRQAQPARQRTARGRPAAPPPPAPPPPPPKEPPPEPEAPRLIPEYCHTTSGSPDDLFSVYLSAPQQTENCFVNMQINNQCLKVRLPVRPTATGMVFAQVKRRAMEPICQVTVGSSVFHPPPVTGQQPALAARPGPKSRQQQPPPPPPAPVAKPSHPCTKCSQRFPTATMLEYHFSVYHAPAASEPPIGGVFECPLCTHWSGLHSRLKEHLSAVHAPRGASNYTCAVCGRAWGRRTADANGLWLRHVLTHAKPRAAGRPAADGRRRTARQMAPPARQMAPTAAKPAHIQQITGQFPCPQCDAVFADVSKFPEHWLKAHAGGAGGGGAAPVAAMVGSSRTARLIPERRGATRQRVDATRETRFAARFDAEPAPAAAAASVSVAATAPVEGDSTLRCTRCGDLFPNEAAYAQHWINAHTRIRLSADQQAAASRSAPASQAAVSAPAPPPVSVESADSNGDTAAAMEEGDARPVAERAAAAAAAADDSAMDTADTGASVTAQNGVTAGGGEPTPLPRDPVEEAAALVPSDADFEMSEETLDKMLEEIVPMKKRK